MILSQGIRQESRSAVGMPVAYRSNQTIPIPAISDIRKAALQLESDPYSDQVFSPCYG